MKKKTITEQFADIVRSYPDQIAVLDGEASISYKLLAHRATALAAHLLAGSAKAAKGQAPIATYLPSSIDFVVSMLGILQSGHPYLPLDLTYPAKRIDDILSQAQCKLVISDSKHAAAFPALETELILVDTLPSEGYEQVELPAIKPDDPAYVIFTSGSTGKPKGAVIRHENLLNTVYWSHEYYDMQAGETGSQIARVVFDASVCEFWAHLLIGNKLLILGQKSMLDIPKLRETVRDEQIDYMQLVAPVAELFMSEPLLPGSCLKWLWLGGEKLNRRPVAGFSAQVSNQYGPTECAIVCSSEDVLAGDSEQAPGIGYPISNTRVYLLNEAMEEVPQGDIGEICIAGAGVGSGYLNAPELTAKAFVRFPPSGELVYRTGDLGRHLADDRLEFCGRKDFQVKIRGFRIELGEIENALLRHPAIQDAIVLAEGPDDSKKLYAFVIPCEPKAILESEMQQHCAEFLVDYMVPENYYILSEFPLTENGKIDRRSLARRIPVSEQDNNENLPLTDFERNLAEIWSEVLKREHISWSDRFYAIGGHSIKAAQVLGILSSRLGLQAGIDLLLTNPTLGEFCDQVSRLHSAVEERIPHIPAKDYPLAYDQQALWYYWKLKPERMDYLICSRFDVSGRFNPDILRQAITQMQKRHPMLRAGFYSRNGEPRLFFREESSFHFEYHLLKQKDAIEREIREPDFLDYPFITSKVLEIEDSFQHQSFDLERDCLFRCALLDFAGESQVLLMGLHHIITDGWSMAIWHRELLSIYRNLANKRETSLPLLSIDYGDYSQFQMRQSPAKRWPEQLSFWRKQLLPLPEAIELPRRLSALHPDTPHGKRVWRYLDPKLSDNLRTLSREEGNSLFATFAGLFKFVLFRYCSNRDLAILSVYGGRKHSQIKPLFGLLTNLFLLRSSLDPDLSLSQQIERENAASVSALQNLDYPYEKLIQDLGLKGKSGAEGIGNIAFIYQNFPFDADSDFLPALTMRDIGTDAAKFDLLLTIEEERDRFLCWFEYKCELYEDALMQRMMDQFEQVLACYAANPHIKQKELDILLPWERKMLVSELNNCVRDYPKGISYVEIWQKNLSHFEDFTAFEVEGKTYSYSDLEEGSSTLAGFLSGMGDIRGKCVALCLPRDYWLPVSFLAIWKLGAYYLPLDPKYPPERLQYMLQDSQAVAVLGDSAYMDTFADICAEDGPFSACRYICLDWNEELIRSSPPLNQNLLSAGDDPAYLIYTSGSTGQPKGVLISHDNLLNHNHAVLEEFDLSTQDRVLQFGAISFDLSVEEIFPTWLAGATLVFRNDAMLETISAFVDFISRHGVSIIDIPTAYWHVLVTELTKHRLPDELRLCIIGGEKALADKLADWIRLTEGKIRLLNTYGPTETTIIATIYEADPKGGYEHYPIGRPIANMQAYVLDEEQGLVPFTAHGELYLGGAGVGLGYLNLPEASSQSFIANPFSADPGARLYKTGDLVAYSEKGELHYLGRSDDQIKLLGHRIEPGEIELSLRRFTDILDAKVILRSGESGRDFLCAYLICKSKLPAIAEMRGKLIQELPEYMVPQAFVALDSFPFTPGGKLDVKALPEVVPEIAPHEKGFVHFYTPEQEVLCDAISNVLGLERVSILDNFFDLGGNSLLSMQLIEKLSHAGLKLKIEQLFISANIEDLAATLELHNTPQGDYAKNCLVELKKGSTDLPPLIFIHSLPGDVLGYVNLVHQLPPEQSAYGIQALGLFEPDKAHHSIREMADFYLELLKRQSFPHGFHLAGWCFGGRVAVEMAQQYRLRTRHAPKVFLFETYAYNPVKSLKIPFQLHRLSLLFVNRYRLPKIVWNRILDKKSMMYVAPQAEVFLERGIFANRTKTRQMNIAAIFSSKLRPYPWPLVLFKAKNQNPQLLMDPTLGWKVFAKNLVIHQVESSHADILKGDQVKQIATIIMDYLRSESV